jgi:8-oxo-dGTP pyrophosphatase MutT (NUDIX family)
MFSVFNTWEGGKKLVPEENIVERHSASGVVLVGDRILLIRLKNSSKMWFPGGTVEARETSQEAARREVKEETGIDVKIGALVAQVVNNFYYTPKDMAWRQYDDFYLCRTDSTELKDFVNPDSADVADGPVWMNIHEIKSEQMQDYGFEVIQLVKENLR